MIARTRTKICGITRLEDALAAADAGVDALGFNFVPTSSRAVDLAAARRIVARLPAFVVPVGLFLDADDDVVARVLDEIPALVPQFHGTESAARCDRHGVPYLKALGLGAVTEGQADAANEPPAAYVGAMGFLLDSHAPGALGGTGVALDWSALGDVASGLDGRPLVLAGGLDPGNVARAIAAVRPWAVDVSSGVESAGKGIKDHDAMRAFLRAVRDADHQRRDGPRDRTEHGERSA